MKTEARALDRVLLLLYLNPDKWFTLKEIVMGEIVMGELVKSVGVVKVSVQLALNRLMCDGVVVRARVGEDSRVVKGNTRFVYKLSAGVKGVDYVKLIFSYI